MEIFVENWFLWTLLALLVFVLAVLLKPSPIKGREESPWNTAPTKSYSMLSVDSESVSLKSPRNKEDFSNLWRMQMEKHGKRMREKDLSYVFFVNGTYAGFDPVDLISLTKSLYPAMPEALERRLQRLSLSGLNKLVKDCGNFLDQYVDLFTQATGGIPAENFKWSSANHHAARLEGAIILLQRLESLLADKKLAPGQRVLFVGHSHAGQVFSIVTQLLNKKERDPLISVASEAFLRREDLERILAQVQVLNFDFVTLGMPPRYSWSLTDKMNLIHLINHRGSHHSAGSVRGLLHTVDGDYVQQSGIRGTDSKATVPKLRMANQKLNAILDGGPDIKRWMADVKLKNRVPKYGYTYLIDYRDNSNRFPNLIRTIFGHGAYTEFRFMEFNTRIIVDHFYR